MHRVNYLKEQYGISKSTIYDFIKRQADEDEIRNAVISAIELTESAKAEC
jgi:hypothetical protein